MPTEADNLQAALNQVAALIVQVTLSPNPDYTVGGRTVSKGTYLTQLIQQQAALRTAMIRAGGPFCVVSRGVP